MNRCSYCFTVNVVDGQTCESSPSRLHAPRPYHLPGQHEQESHGGEGGGNGGLDAITPKFTGTQKQLKVALDRAIVKEKEIAAKFGRNSPQGLAATKAVIDLQDKYKRHVGAR